MASAHQRVTGSADAAVTEHDWTSSLLPHNGDVPPSYVEPNKTPVAYHEKPTTLLTETKALTKSSVRLLGGHI